MFFTKQNQTITPAIVDTGSFQSVLKTYHENGVDDQFIPPMVRVDAEGKPMGMVKEGDVLIYYDFRTDRAKPLTAAFLDIPFEGQVANYSWACTCVMRMQEEHARENSYRYVGRRSFENSCRKTT